MNSTNTIQVANYIKKSNLARDIRCPINYSDIILNLENLDSSMVPITAPIPSGLYCGWFVSYLARMQSGVRGSYFQVDSRVNRQMQLSAYDGKEWDAGRQLMRESIESYIDCSETENIVHNNKVRHFLHSVNHLGMVSVMEYFNNSLTLYVPRQWGGESNLAESYTGYSPSVLGMATLNYAGIKQQGLKLATDRI